MSGLIQDRQVYVLKNNNIKSKADLYVEGTDQHRGCLKHRYLKVVQTMMKVHIAVLTTDLLSMKKGKNVKVFRKYNFS